ncbi:putative inactive carboxylesterase 4 [Patiria miniata]|uniref:Carboxylic ester hydrolase n=1 Tax=Patiria miniata TaxID=46514 RepID=A0A913ZZD2_PATMI|nr:putative inactive carboxylesterase 4 [Patiria miniata]
MKMLRSYYFMFLAAIIAVFCLLVEGFIVRTSAGKIRGVLRDLDGVGYRLYAGIPYAEAPIGRLRFAAPVARKSWQGIRNATRYGPSCPQNISNVAKFYPDYVVRIPDEAMVVSEDCLSLNVFAPGDCSSSSGLAVMVWVHGGSYATGQGSGYDASALAVRGRVVVVTINYRLNVFGFLSTNDENAPGNYGLLDQQLALQWVHENIAGFGGDPSRVTLFGQSAGGAAATLHLFAPNSRRLFQRVGAIGGYFEPSHAASGPRMRQYANVVGRNMNCTHDTTTDLVQCLRERTMHELLAAGLELEQALILPVIWGPVIDGHLLFPHHVASNDSLDLHHDLMISFCTGDGSVILEALPFISPRELNLSVGVTPLQWTRFLTYLWRTPLQQEAIGFAYPALDDPSRGRAIVDLMTDWNFLADVPSTLDKVTTVRSVYMSVFDYRSSANTRYPWLQPSPHSEDLSYIFGLPYNASGLGSRFTTQETALSNRLITYWSNFAKSG